MIKKNIEYENKAKSQTKTAFLTSKMIWYFAELRQFHNKDRLSVGKNFTDLKTQSSFIYTILLVPL